MAVELPILITHPGLQRRIEVDHPRDPVRRRARLERLLDERGVNYVEYDGWQAIDAAERGAGEPLGRPRVKLTAWERLLETAQRKITR